METHGSIAIVIMNLIMPARGGLIAFDNSKKLIPMLKFFYQLDAT
jgi:hypothetical protein